VESYEVMTAGAPYKPSKPVAEAIAELQHLAGTQFDPAMVKEFVQMLKEGHF
jgi:HD-GYP domain-containing protein (c-di-GMP phosphodiesterase class II)